MENDVTGPARLAHWLTGKWISHAISAAAKLSIAELLQDGGHTVDDLADKTDSHASSLYRLLRALASIGIFSESKPRYFESTTLGALLARDDVKSACLMMHSEWHDRAWSQLLYSIRTGKSAFHNAHGAPLFEWLAQHPEAQKLFDGAMTAGRSHRNHGIVEHYDFTSFNSIVDVGGGEGSLVALLLERYPHLTARIADLPTTLEAARQTLAKAGLSERCDFIPTDFFVGVPPNADVYILAHILHDWDDQRCKVILSNCRLAMQQKSRLLLVETPLEDTSADRVNWLDLEMLVLTEGGRERTLEAYRELLAESGFELLRAISTGGNRSVIEARRNDSKV